MFVLLFLLEKLSEHCFIKTRSTKNWERDNDQTKSENLFKLLLCYFLFLQILYWIYIQIAIYSHMIVVYYYILFLIIIVEFWLQFWNQIVKYAKF